MKKERNPIIGQIVKQYIEHISILVINEYGGSYQNFQNTGKRWRQTFSYKKEIEDFLYTQTNVFLKTHERRDDLNIMNNVCTDISKFLALYMARKSTDKIPNKVLYNTATEIFKKIFSKSPYFAAMCEEHCKKRKVENSNFRTSNPGIMTIWRAKQKGERGA